MARTSRAKKRLLLLAIVLAGAAVAIGAAYAGMRMYRHARALAAREEGWRLFDEGDYAGALGPLSRYVGPNQHDIDAVLRLARAREEVEVANGRHLVDAIGFYKAARSGRPNDLTALEGLVRCYAKLDYGHELERAAEELLRVDPDSVTGLEARLGHFYRRGRWEPAQADAERLVAVEPDNYRWRILVLEVLRSSGADAATREAVIKGWIAQAAESDRPQDGRFQLFLAHVYTSDGRVEQAKAAAREASRLGMPDTDMLAALINMLDTLEMGDEAAEAIANAARKGVDPAALAVMQVRRHYLAGRLDEARAELDAAADTSTPSTVDLRRWNVIIAESMSDVAASDRAMAELISFAQSDPAIGRDIERWCSAVKATRDSDGDPTDLRAAIEALEAGLAAMPGDPFLLLRSGDLALRLREFDLAVRRYRMAYQAESSRWALAGIQLTSALLAAGRTDEAFRMARELLWRFENHPMAVLVLAGACDALLREGRTPSAVDPTLPATVSAARLLEILYEEVLKGDERLLAPIVSARLVEGNEASATSYVKQAIADEATSAEVLLQLSALVSDRRFAELPAQAIKAAQARGAAAADVTVAQARVRLARGDATGARFEVESALEAPSAPLTPRELAMLARVRAEAAIAANASDATAVLGHALKVGGDADTAMFVLAHEASWADEALVNAAIGELKKWTGERSPQVLLNEAAVVLRFHRNDADEVAKAVLATDDLLKSDPESVGALVMLSRLLATKSPPDHAQAAKWMGKALLLQPGRRELYPELIALLQASGDFAGANRAILRYEQACEGDPDSARRAAQLRIAQGEYASAISSLERIARTTGDEYDTVALADAKRRVGQVDEAERLLQAACALPNRSPLAVLALVELYARTARLAEARRVIEDDAALASPTLTPANRAYTLARLELDYGDPAAAGPFVDEALRLAPDAPSVHYLDARRLLAARDISAAVACARIALKRWPEDPELLAFVSSLMIADPQSRDSAAEALAALKDQNPPLYELVTVVRECEGPGGTLAPKAEHLETLVSITERYPRFAPGWIAAAELHAAAGRPDAAIAIARRAMARVPNESGPAELAARLLLAERRFEEARDAAYAWRALAADSPIDADLVLARVALLSGKTSDAVLLVKPYGERLAVEAGTRPDGIALYALVLLMDGQPDVAFASVKDSLLAHREVLVEWLRGVRAAPTALAMDALGRTEALVAKDDDGRFALASEYVALGRRKEAKEALAKAAALMASSSAEARRAPIARLLAADLASASGNPEEAAAGYDGVLAEVPAASREQVLRWLTLDPPRRDELAGARSVILYANNNKAATLADAGIDLDSALAAIDEALRVDPDAGALLDTKATVLLARKEFDQARSVATEASKRTESPASVLITLARIELGAGRPSEARRHLQAAERDLAADPFAERTLLERVAEVKAEIERVAAGSTT